MDTLKIILEYYERTTGKKYRPQFDIMITDTTAVNQTFQLSGDTIRVYYRIETDSVASSWTITIKSALREYRWQIPAGTPIELIGAWDAKSEVSVNYTTPVNTPVFLYYMDLIPDC